MTDKLPEPTLKTANAGIDAMQQDMTRKNIEEALREKDVLKLAEAVAAFNLAQIREEIALGIKLNVNGKIDDMREENERWHTERKADLKRIMPVVEAFEEGQHDLNSAKRGGKIVLWLAATIVSLGGAWLVTKQVFNF